MLLPQLWAGAIVLMDNLPVHHALVVRKALKAVGAQAVFCRPTLTRIISDCISADEALAWFAHCG
jgi:hypothetical protein